MIHYNPLLSKIELRENGSQEWRDLTNGLDGENAFVSQPKGDYVTEMAMGGEKIAYGSIDLGATFSITFKAYSSSLDFMTVLRMRMQRQFPGPFDVRHRNPQHGYLDQYLQCVFIESPRGMSGGTVLQTHTFSMECSVFIPDYTALNTTERSVFPGN